MADTGLRRTPLFDRHVAAGARMVPFAGFEMPVLYTSILAEHRQVRASAGLFDVSHMGEIRIRGAGALELAQAVFTNDALGMRDGQVRYGLLCREDGGVIDDLTLYREAEDDLFVCANAANVAAVFTWLTEVNEARGGRCEVIDESGGTALLAAQGPEARAIVDALRQPGAPPVRRWRFAREPLAGVPACLSRTGYTGEDGYEVYLPAERAVELWDALLAAGDGRIAPAGLGARDTLRTEMAYPLYGHELSLEGNPIEAGLERFVCFGRGFIGEAALARCRDAGPARRLVGVVLEGRRVARPGAPIRAGAERGIVTSGTFGPTVERSIAIGYVPTPYAEVGTRLAVEVRGAVLPCEVTPTPFFDRKA